MTEPLYDPSNYNLLGSYHFDEIHALSITALFMNKGLSEEGVALQNGEGLFQGTNFDAELAPSMESMYLFSYQVAAYYGKISLTKQTVANLTLYGLLGGEMVSFGDSSHFGFHVGLGQKFYMGSHAALRLDLRLLAYQGPDPTSDSCRLNTGTAATPECRTRGERSSSDLDTRVYYHTLLNVAAVFLL
jgi:outer membrane beta-barrel protein